MRQIALAAFALLFTIFTATVFAQNGEQEKTPATASVSGRILIDGKPARGIVLYALPSGNISSSSIRKLFKGLMPWPQAVTNEGGHFKLTDLEAGQYQLNALAPAMVLIDEVGSARLGVITLNNGAAVEDVVLSLTRGGVITGRVTHADGSPVIGAIIDCFIEPQREKDQITTPRYTPMFHPEKFGTSGWFRTDDRGIYRIYGLVEGLYKVRVSFDDPKSLDSRHYWRVFYPKATDDTKATLVRVETGAETRDIDIKLGTPDNLYTVTGRVTEAETGRPLSDFPLSCFPYSMRTGGVGYSCITNNKGEFRFNALPSGNYQITTSTDLSNERNFYIESMDFQIKDGDLSGFEIKAHQGLTLSGIIVTENLVNTEAKAKIPQLQIRASSMQWKRSGGDYDASAFSIANIAPDGSFLIKGVSPGKISIELSATSSGFAMVSLERGGKDITEGFELQPGENVNDIRIIVAETDCALRGRVVVEGGILPDDASLSISARRITGTTPDPYDYNFIKRFSVEPNGRFIGEGLVAGQYELTLIAEVRSKTRIDRWIAKQAARVASKQTAEITITLDLNVDKER